MNEKLIIWVNLTNQYCIIFHGLFIRRCCCRTNGRNCTHLLSQQPITLLDCGGNITFLEIISQAQSFDQPTRHDYLHIIIILNLIKTRVLGVPKRRNLRLYHCTTNFLILGVRIQMWHFLWWYIPPSIWCSCEFWCFDALFVDQSIYIRTKSK